MRRLSLRKEALAELTARDLADVAAGQPVPTFYCPASLAQCLTAQVATCDNISAALADCPFGA